MKKIFIFLLSCLACCSMKLCGAEPAGCRKSGKTAYSNKGIVCFTFDDFDPDGWVKAIRIFKKYNAHATFFFSGKIDRKRLRVMKKLSAAGHSIGLHTVTHSNAVPLKDGDSIEKYFEREILPQLEICRANGIRVKAFAYPNNRRTPETDAFLYKYFDHLRAGYGPAKKVVYVPVDRIEPKMVLAGGGIGQYYNSRFSDLAAILDHAAGTGQLTVFFSHKIKPDATGVHMSPELLEQLLDHAHKLGMYIAGADELAAVRAKNCR